MAMTARMQREVEALIAAAVTAGGPAADQARAVAALLKPSAPRKAKAVNTAQRSFWDEPTGAPWRITPDTYVRCSHFNVSAMRAAVCLERQVARFPGGNRMGDGSIKQKTASIYPYCGSGQCVEGAAYKAAMPPGYEPKLKTNPGHVFYKPDLNVQRRKRRVAMMSRPEGEPPDLDHPPGSQHRDEVDLADPDIQFILDGGGSSE